MKLLLDTCVISEVRHPKGNPRVREALQRYHEDDLFLSALTVGEMQKGVLLLADGRRKSELSEWLAGLRRQFSPRILPVDEEVAVVWAELTAAAQSNGRIVPAVDGLIAATALRHGMALMTRNVHDFAATGVRLVNPWTGAGVHDAV